MPSQRRGQRPLRRGVVRRAGRALLRLPGRGGRGVRRRRSDHGRLAARPLRADLGLPRRRLARTAPDPLSHFLARADRAGLSTHPLLTDGERPRAAESTETRAVRERGVRRPRRRAGGRRPERAARGQRRRPVGRRASGRSRGGCAASTAHTPGTTRPWRSSSSSGRTPTAGWPCWSPCRCRAPGSPTPDEPVRGAVTVRVDDPRLEPPPWPWLHHLVDRLEDPAVGRVGPLLVERDQTVVAAAALPRARSCAGRPRRTPRGWRTCRCPTSGPASSPSAPPTAPATRRTSCPPRAWSRRAATAARPTHRELLDHRRRPSTPAPLARRRLRGPGPPAARRRGPAGAALGDRHRRAAGSARAALGRRPVRAQPGRRPRTARPVGDRRPSRDPHPGLARPRRRRPGDPRPRAGRPDRGRRRRRRAAAVGDQPSRRGDAPRSARRTTSCSPPRTRGPPTARRPGGARSGRCSSAPTPPASTPASPSRTAARRCSSWATPGAPSARS